MLYRWKEIGPLLQLASVPLDVLDHKLLKIHLLGFAAEGRQATKTGVDATPLSRSRLLVPSVRPSSRPFIRTIHPSAHSVPSIPSIPSVPYHIVPDHSVPFYTSPHRPRPPPIDSLARPFKRPGLMDMLGAGGLAGPDAGATGAAAGVAGAVAAPSGGGGGGAAVPDDLLAPRGGAAGGSAGSKKGGSGGGGGAGGQGTGGVAAGGGARRRGGPRPVKIEEVADGEDAGASISLGGGGKKGD